jgi:hypothetical protein
MVAAKYLQFIQQRAEEFMVSNAACGQPNTFSVWTQFTVQTGKRSELPRGMPLATRV